MSERKVIRLDTSVRCACGEIELRVHGRVLTMLLCTCTDCQRATGTGHASVAMLRREDVTLSGNAATFERPADSGATFARTFCPTCGTPIFGISSRASDVVLVPVGLFPDNGDWYDPRRVIFVRSHRAWDVIADHIPRSETYPQREG